MKVQLLEVSGCGKVHLLEVSGCGKVHLMEVSGCGKVQLLMCLGVGSFNYWRSIMHTNYIRAMLQLYDGQTNSIKASFCLQCVFELLSYLSHIPSH